MSLATIALTKADEDASAVTYLVTSPDFAAGTWAEIAQVVIDKASRTYEFQPVNQWAGKKVVPPYVYGLDDMQREALLAEAYAGHSYGAWTARIFSRVRHLLAQPSYPESC